MPPHQRRIKDSDEKSAKKLSGKAQNIFSKITGDVKALNSSILVISQKIKYVVRNEKILGRNLLVLNKKIKSLQTPVSGGGDADFSAIQPELAEINRKLSENAEAIAGLQSEVQNIRENYAKSGDVAEIKYVIDTINPLEFVSVKDVKELIAQQKTSSAKKKK